MKTKLTLSVPADVIKAAKLAAVQQDKSVSQIVTDLLRQALGLPPPNDHRSS